MQTARFPIEKADVPLLTADVVVVGSGAASLNAAVHLKRLGVEDVVILTDHDMGGRGTSAGPKTSMVMVEKLLDEAEKEVAVILNHMQVIELLTSGAGEKKRIAGLLSIDSENRLIVVRTDYVVFGTGGPGALYADSVYPQSQTGSLGIALKAGAKAQNLTECQFGIASTGFRWNLSGSYQQVIPRYVSSAHESGDTREFLNDYFPSFESQITAQFLKGYQWPFDVRKLSDRGPSIWISGKTRGAETPAFH